MDFNPQLAAHLAQDSADAYHAATIDAPETGTQVLVTQKTGDLFFGGATVFAFRGTSDFRDALTDANVLMMGAPDLPEREGRLHRGCVRAVESVIDQLARICRESPAGTKFLFTGHSLGGGLAPIAAYLLALEGFAVAGVVTFAGLRVCDPTFRRNYNRLLGDRTQRIVAQYDVVPHLPFPGWLLPYRHVGAEVYLASTDPENLLEVPKAKMQRGATECLVADALTLFKAWRVAKFNPLALPQDVAAMHSIARYQRLLGNLNLNPLIK